MYIGLASLAFATLLAFGMPFVLVLCGRGYDNVL